MVREILVFVLVLTAGVGYSAAPLDSIGVTQKKGKNYILHKVEAKETLYSLSRKYNVSVDEIKSSNEDLGELKVGQTVLIPAPKTATVAPSTRGTIIHTVQPKETLYGLSRKYSVSVDDIKKANPGLDELKVGQEVFIPKAGKVEDKPVTNKKLPSTHKVEPKETFYSISKKYGITIEELKKNNPDVKELQVGQVIGIAGPVNSDATNIENNNTKEQDVVYAPTDKKTTTNTDKKAYVEVKEPKLLNGPENNVPTSSNLKKDGYTKVNETGMAELYNDNTGFHYALHKTAPVGTIIYLVNEANGQKVYVRVMGKLTDAAPGVIIKISPKAFEKLGKGDQKLKVNATYIP